MGGILVSARDVTEQERAASALREAEAKYRALVERLPAVTCVDAVAAEESTAVTVHVGPHVEAWLGHGPAER